MIRNDRQKIVAKIIKTNSGTLMKKEKFKNTSPITF